MLTSITKKNISHFEHLIPEDYVEDLLIRKDYCGIGVYRLEDEKFAGVGTLIYKKEIEDDLDSNIKIIWIYVDDNHRDENIGSELLTELFWLVGNTDIETITIDYPASDEYEQLGTFLEEWHFAFNRVNVPELYMSFDEIKNLPMLKNPKDADAVNEIHPLKDVTPKMLNAFFKKAVSYRKKNDEYIDADLLNYNYMDSECSSVYVKDDTIESAFLLHKKPSGDFELIFHGGYQEKTLPKIEFGLPIYSLSKATEIYPKDSALHFICTTESDIKLMDYIFDHPELIVYLRGIIDNSGLGISSEDWEIAKEEYKNEHPKLVKELEDVNKSANN